jgi:hypothetical protein
LQSSNLTPSLRAQGLSNTEPLKYHYDGAADLGGRLIRDQLWFYGGFSRQHRISNPLGFVQDVGSDGVYLSGDEPLADFDASITQFNVKLSWQLSKNNRLIGVYQKGTKLQSDHGAGRFRPAEATRDYYDPTWVKKGELQSTINAQTLVNVVGGFGGYYADYSALRNPLYKADKPSRLDRETGLRTGGHEASDQRPREHQSRSRSITPRSNRVYFPASSELFSTSGQNVLRPREVYNIPLSRRDPGPDGLLDTTDDGGRVTIYDYDPAYRGAAFVGDQVVNSPEVDTYHTIEFALTKRATGRWMASASFFAVKTHQWLTRVFDSPNADYFPIDDTWGWAGNATASYRLPWDVQFAGFLQTKQGVKGQRTNVFRAADPDGGTPLRQLSTVTLRLEPYGSQRGAPITLVNLRTSKDFTLTRGRRIGFDVDLYNLLNTSAPTSMTFTSGPTFGYVTGVMAARIVRFGARFSF